MYGSAGLLICVIASGSRGWGAPVSTGGRAPWATFGINKGLLLLTNGCQLWFTPRMANQKKLNEDAVSLLNEIGQSDVARRMSVSRQAVSKWRVHGIPPGRAKKMRRAYPDAPWSDLPGAIGRGVGR